MLLGSCHHWASTNSLSNVVLADHPLSVCGLLWFWLHREPIHLRKLFEQCGCTDGETVGLQSTRGVEIQASNIIAIGEQLIHQSRWSLLPCRYSKRMNQSIETLPWACD